MFEYNFFNINDDQEKAQSPYIFVGVGAFSAKGKEYDYDGTNNVIIEKTKYNTDLTIPFGVGYKVRFNYNWILSFETGVRYTNVDYIDYNTGKFSEEYKNIFPNFPYDNEVVYGNLSNKDWYVLTGISLTYSFGRPACYCD